MLLVCLPWLDAEGNARVFALFAEADDSFEYIFLITGTTCFIELQLYDIKMLDLE